MMSTPRDTPFPDERAAPLKEALSVPSGTRSRVWRAVLPAIYGEPAKQMRIVAARVVGVSEHQPNVTLIGLDTGASLQVEGTFAEWAGKLDAFHAEPR